MAIATSSSSWYHSQPSTPLNRSQSVSESVSESVSDKHCQWSYSGPIKNQLSETAKYNFPSIDIKIWNYSHNAERTGLHSNHVRFLWGFASIRLVTNCLQSCLIAHYLLCAFNLILCFNNWSYAFSDNWNGRLYRGLYCPMKHLFGFQLLYSWSHLLI